MVELKQQEDKSMKKIICLAMIAWTISVLPAKAQYGESEYSGYYGQTGPAESNGNGSYNGNPIIYVFYNKIKIIYFYHIPPPLIVFCLIIILNIYLENYML